MKRKMRNFGSCAGEMPLRTSLFAVALIVNITLGFQDGNPGVWTIAGSIFSLFVFAGLGALGIRMAIAVWKRRELGFGSPRKESHALYNSALSVVGLMSFAICEPIHLNRFEIEVLIFAAFAIIMGTAPKPLSVFEKRL